MLNSKVKAEAVESASKWILESGIQSQSGGFYAWYDLDSQTYPFLYSEITGYAITTLLFFNKIFNKDIFIARAEKAAVWINQCAMHPCGGVKARLYNNDAAADKRYSFSGENIFSFDTGMALYGMVNLFKLTREKSLLSAAKAMAGFLVEMMQDKNGSFLPVYNAKAKKTLEFHDKWSNQAGSFLAKVALGLVDLYSVTADNLYKDSAIKICEYALSKQDKSGRFITDAFTNTTNLHPHCYTAEGLLYTGASFGISRFVESAKKAVDWVFKHLNEERINELYAPLTGGFNQLQMSDVLAQALRLGLLFGVSSGYTKRLKELLMSYQYFGGDAEQNGGFLYSNSGNCINSWCTMFAIQALSIYNNQSILAQDFKGGLFI